MPEDLTRKSFSCGWVASTEEEAIKKNKKNACSFCIEKKHYMVTAAKAFQKENEEYKLKNEKVYENILIIE